MPAGQRGWGQEPVGRNRAGDGWLPALGGRRAVLGGTLGGGKEVVNAIGQISLVRRAHDERDGGATGGRPTRPRAWRMGIEPGGQGLCFVRILAGIHCDRRASLDAVGNDRGPPRADGSGKEPQETGQPGLRLEIRRKHVEGAGQQNFFGVGDLVFGAPEVDPALDEQPGGGYGGCLRRQTVRTRFDHGLHGGSLGAAGRFTGIRHQDRVLRAAFATSPGSRPGLGRKYRLSRVRSCSDGCVLRRPRGATLAG